jgi:hypothetical protein
MMMLKDLLSQKKASILKKWFHLIFETYPPDSSGFLNKEKNRFKNPVGHTIAQSIESIFDELIRGKEIDKDKVTPFLDNIIRIRAVQDFSPSRAIAFIFLLKGAVKEELEREIRQHRLFEELLRFNSDIDNLALLGFNIYMECRERLYKIRINEWKRASSNLLKKANLISGTPMEASNLEEFHT